LVLKSGIYIVDGPCRLLCYIPLPHLVSEATA